MALTLSGATVRPCGDAGKDPSTNEQGIVTDFSVSLGLKPFTYS